MQESIDKIKGAAAIIQNMVSTDEEVVYNDLALFFTAKLLYEAIDELEEYLNRLKGKNTRGSHPFVFLI